MTRAAFFVMLWASKGKAKEASMKCSSCHTENPPDSKFCKECATPLPSSRPSPPLVTETLETAGEQVARSCRRPETAGRAEPLIESDKSGDKAGVKPTRYALISRGTCVTSRFDPNFNLPYKK